MCNSHHDDPPDAEGVTAQDHVAAVPWVEVYGFRGCHREVYYLAPWEFAMDWYPEQLLPPPHAKSLRRTRWLPGGEAFSLEHQDDAPAVCLEPGKHYAVVEPSTE